MRKYFGTDGIRRIANTELSPELVYRVAKAGAYVLSKHSKKTPTILIGRDTRLSGTLIESAMVAGFLSYGANVKLLGVIPTPGVAYLTRKLQADASVVISASHNTYEFNGIKYFSNKGMKIPDDVEKEIEEVMDSGKLDELSAVSEKIGVSEVSTDLLDEYVYFFRKNFDDNIARLNRPDFKVVIDTANGATYQVADKVFTTLGINHVIINNKPDGININAGCGSTHLEMLKEYVVKNKMSLGIAYDGDGDRCLAVDAFFSLFRLPDPLMIAQLHIAVKVVFTIIYAKLVGYSIQFKCSSPDAVCIRPYCSSKKASVGKIGLQGIISKHHIFCCPLPIRYKQIY